MDKKIPASDVQRLATHLANGGWCRYWLHWNHPYCIPWVMALEFRRFDDGEFRSIKVEGMEREGWEWDDVDQRYYAHRDLSADGINATGPVTWEVINA